MSPNPKQREAITGTGIQLILAGPGSGKTRVITEKILHLLEGGARPSEILALTFSEKAAREMESRLEEMTDVSDLSVRTFHSFCLDVLQENVLDSGLNFSAGLISRTNQLVWGLRNIDRFGFETIEVGNNASGVIESIIDGISAFRDELITPDELAAYLRDGAETDPDRLTVRGQLADLQKVYAAYERYKRSEFLLDYDDMIAEAVRLFEQKPHILNRYRKRFRYILVDEFQDTNYAQFTLIKLLCGDHLCVVGDDDQTIYRFRGAYFGNFQDFRDTFSRFTETVLDRNYRNSGTILALALQLMQRAPNRREKLLFTENPPGENVVVAECENESSEALYVLREIRQLQDVSFFYRKDGEERTFRYRDIAILCRRRAEGLKFHQMLRQYGIPAEFAGEVNFFDVPAVRDVVAYVKAIDNPLTAGIALNRIMRGAGIPEAAVQRVNADARERAWHDPAGDGVFEAMQAFEKGPYLHQIREVARHVEALVARKDALPLPELVYEVIMRSTGIYRRALAEETGQGRRALDQLLTVSREYAAITRDAHVADFLEYLALLSDFPVEVGEQDDRDAVQIMTIHASKGKEFPVVFLVDMAQRKFPLDYRRKPFAVPRDLARGLATGDDERALHLQEERRLCYVAMTRAEELLYLTRALRYGENKNESKPSLFLTEVSYRTNPLIRVEHGPAGVTDAGAGPANPVDERKCFLQDQIVRAVFEMRTRTALERLVELEKIRLLETGEDPGLFDREAFFDLPGDSDIPGALLQGQRLPLVTDSHTFSASSLQTYRDCPLRYKYQHVLLVPGLPKPFFSMGSAVHSVIEHLSRDQMDGILPTYERALRLLDRFWAPAGFTSRTQEREKRSEGEAVLSTYLAWQERNRSRILAVEQNFRFTFLDHRVKGFIDRVEQTPEGGYVVVDFKTGSKPSDVTKRSLPENIQLNLYALAVRELYGVLPERATLYYLKDDQQVDYTPTEASIAAFSESLSGLIDRVRAEEFPATPSYGCRWCDYRDLCREADA